jgi:hypothetical protein
MPRSGGRHTPRARTACCDPCMRENSVELDMVRQHVAIGARCLARQFALIVRLRRRGLPADEAEALLILFEDIQRRHLEHLARLEAREGVPPT